MINNFHPVGRTLWLPIRWNIFYITINTFQIAKLLSERFVSLEPEERAMYKAHFSNALEEPEFKSLVRLGKWETTTRREAVIKKDVPNSRLIVVTDDSRPLIALADDGAAHLVQYDRAYVFGEASFLHGVLPSATVWLEPGTRYFAWDRKAVDESLGPNSKPFRGLEVLISRQLCAKLSSTSGALEKASRKKSEDVVGG